MQRNVANQKWTVFAFYLSTGLPVLNDANNITATIRIDDSSAVATNDINPTEQSNGFYVFDLTQAETNGNKLTLFPVSTTADVMVIGCHNVEYTTLAATVIPTFD